MSSEERYSPPSADTAGPRPPKSGGGISFGMIEPLRKTRPWVQLVGVMVLLGCVFILLAGVVIIIAGAMGGEMGPFGGTLVGVVYLVLAALYLIPGLHLLRYASSIKKLDVDDPATLEAALTQQFAFWRFVGVVTLAVIGFYILLFLGLVVLGFLGALS